MYRANWKYLLLAAILAGVITTGATQAEACGWWGSCRSASWCCDPCYTPCYTACYTVSCDPCCVSDCGGWYAGYRPGPIRRLLFGAYRPYWSGYYSYSYCDCGWCDVCCDEAVTVGEPAGEPAATTLRPTLAPERPEPETPSMPDSPSDQTAPPPPDGAQPPAPPGLDTPPDAGPSTLRTRTDGLRLVGYEAPTLPGELPGPATDVVLTRANGGLLTVWVPADAKLFINGLETTSTGTQREYVSYGLQEGFWYQYEIQALVRCTIDKVAEGEAVEDVKEWRWLTRTVVLTAGDHERVIFADDLKMDSELAEGIRKRMQLKKEKLDKLDQMRRELAASE